MSCIDLRRNDLSRRRGDTEIKENEIGTAVMDCDHSSVFLSRFSGKVVLATEDPEITEKKTFIIRVSEF